MRKSSQLPASSGELRRVRFVIYQESCRREAATTVRGCFVSGVGDVQVHYGGRCNRLAYAPASPGNRGPRGSCTLVAFASSPLRRPLAIRPSVPFSAIPPTIAAANTFPGTRVMILLYYANYAVAAHGQWCILMAIVAQRGAIAIDQSCSGYANSSSTWRTRSAESGAERTGMDDGR